MTSSIHKIICILTLLLFHFCASAEIKKVGVILPLSGPLTPQGYAIQNAIQIAKDTVPGGSEVEFIFTDDQFQPKNTITEFQKLLETNKPDIFITFGSGTSIVAANLAKKNKLPLIAISITEKVLEDNSYVLRHFLPLEQQNNKIVEKMLELKINSAAVISTDQEAMVTLQKHFLEKYPNTIPVKEIINPTDQDLRSLANKIKSSKAEAVYLLLLPPQLSILAKQLNEIQYSGKLFSYIGVATPTENQAANGTLTGTYYSSNDDSFSEPFIKEYIKRNKVFGSMEALNGYDIAKFIIEGRKSKDILKYFQSQTLFSGSLGNYKLINNNFQIPVTIKRVKEISY